MSLLLMAGQHEQAEAINHVLKLEFVVALSDSGSNPD